MAFSSPGAGHVFEGEAFAEFVQSFSAIEPGSPAGPLVAGHRYKVTVRIGAIRSGAVFVSVGGNRSKPFVTAGEHVDYVAAGPEQRLALQGVNALAEVDLWSVRAVLS